MSAGRAKWKEFSGNSLGSRSFPVAQSFNHRRFVPESGCKSRAFMGTGQILPQVFSKFFRSFSCLD